MKLWAKTMISGEGSFSGLMVGAAAIGLSLGAGVTTPLQAQITDDIENIEIINTDGPVEQTSSFIPATQGGHFSLGTLDVDEQINTPGMPGPNNQIAWWDLEIKVTRVPGVTDVMMAIDKDVLNETPFTWTDFHMTLGTGLGNNFIESDENDGLFFKLNPAPIEETGAFINPPMLDRPIEPDNLWWFNHGPTGVSPGLPPGGIAFFWLSINIPDSFFGADDMATFTLREHASVPEPLTILGVGTAAGFGTFFKRQLSQKQARKKK